MYLDVTIYWKEPREGVGYEERLSCTGIDATAWGMYFVGTDFEMYVSAEHFLKVEVVKVKESNNA